MPSNPQLWIVAVQYKDEPTGEWGRWSVHRGTADEMARVFERLVIEPTVRSAFKARVHEVVGGKNRRLLNG